MGSFFDLYHKKDEESPGCFGGRLHCRFFNFGGLHLGADGQPNGRSGDPIRSLPYPNCIPNDGSGSFCLCSKDN